MRFQYMLAPLEDFTDNAFRELCYNHGADLTFTVMARLKGLVKENNNTEKKITLKSAIPTQIQLIAQKEEELITFLNRFEPEKGFEGINFNLGCPSPHLVTKGLGCAMMKRTSKINRMITIVKDHGYPCSIKMRLGMNAYEKEKKVYLNLINSTDADFYIIHARHGKETYADPPDYTIYPECVKTNKPIIANGNIDTIEKVTDLKNIGISGIMIGRPAITNPSIFEQIKGLPVTPQDTLMKEYSELEKKYNEPKKYQNNILKHFGKKATLDKENTSG